MWETVLYFSLGGLLGYVLSSLIERRIKLRIRRRHNRLPDDHLPCAVCNRILYVPVGSTLRDRRRIAQMLGWFFEEENVLCSSCVKDGRESLLGERAKKTGEGF